MIDSKHIPKILNNAEIASRSATEFMESWNNLYQVMIDAGCFEDKKRLPSFPLKGLEHAALLTLAADVGNYRLRDKIKEIASSLEATVRILREITPPSPPDTSFA